MKIVYCLFFIFSAISFAQNPCPGLATVTYLGKTYNTVQIGTQCWLKENLDIGTMIQGSQTQTNNGIIEKYCYNNDTANCIAYGGLYQWNEAMAYSTTPGTKGICPDGWHIPTKAEFELLTATTGKNSNSLKAIGHGTGSGTGTNSSGFSALLTGYRSGNGFFNLLGYFTNFWSSTESISNTTYNMNLQNSSSNVFLYLASPKPSGYSIRCVKD